MNITRRAIQNHVGRQVGKNSQMAACKDPVRRASPPMNRQCGRASRNADLMSVPVPWSSEKANVALHQ